MPMLPDRIDTDGYCESQRSILSMLVTSSCLLFYCNLDLLTDGNHGHQEREQERQEHA